MSKRDINDWSNFQFDWMKTPQWRSCVHYALVNDNRKQIGVSFSVGLGWPDGSFLHWRWPHGDPTVFTAGVVSFWHRPRHFFAVPLFVFKRSRTWKSPAWNNQPTVSTGALKRRTQLTGSCLQTNPPPPPQPPLLPLPNPFLLTIEK